MGRVRSPRGKRRQIEFGMKGKRAFKDQVRRGKGVRVPDRAQANVLRRPRSEAANREEEMQAVIQRLKESLNQRPIDEERRMSRHCMFSVYHSLNTQLTLF